MYKKGLIPKKLSVYKHLIILLCVILLRESNAHAEKDDVVDEILESLDENDDKDNGDDSNNNKSSKAESNVSNLNENKSNFDSNLDFNEKNELDEFEIEAKNISFDNIKKHIIAKGNVKIQNKKYSISADKLTYNTQNKVIEVEGNVVTKDLEMNGVYFAQKARFDLKNKTMLMSAVQGNLRNARLTAKNIKSETEGIYTSEMCITNTQLPYRST